jgi:septal ring factor EnvC (AmiA/AmiB activator)
MNRRLREWRLVIGAVIGALIAVEATPLAMAQQDVGEAERNLVEVRKRMKALEKDIKRRTVQRDHEQQALRAAETAEGELRRKISGLERDKTGVRQRLAELDARAVAQRKELTAQLDTLKQQLRLAYVTGEEQWLRLVFSQQDPSGVGRQTVYHSYLARQRNENVAAVRAELSELEKITTELAAEESRLTNLEQQERDRLAELAGARKKRSVALARIDDEIESRAGDIKKLQAEAAELEALVEELTRLLASLPAADGSSFGQGGQMGWPTNGTLLKDFGQSRADGRLSWDGVLLGAPAGSDVRAVHHGRVVFADWLTGMGLLLIVEHGDGYLSLYGHNQDLVKNVGDRVEPGEVIAHVGDSGGQAVPGLYFELRKDGRPVNPHQWIPR